jgi:hypothetical protein
MISPFETGMSSSYVHFIRTLTQSTQMCGVGVRMGLQGWFNIVHPQKEGSINVGFRILEHKDICKVS